MRTKFVQWKVTSREKERNEKGRGREREREKEDASSSLKSRRQSQLRDKFSTRVSLAYALIIALLHYQRPRARIIDLEYIYEGNPRGRARTKVAGFLRSATIIPVSPVYNCARGGFIELVQSLPILSNDLPIE